LGGCKTEEHADGLAGHWEVILDASAADGLRSLLEPGKRTPGAAARRGRRTAPW
jgi:hypothetical protein